MTMRSTAIAQEGVSSAPTALALLVLDGGGQVLGGDASLLAWSGYERDQLLGLPLDRLAVFDADTLGGTGGCTRRGPVQGWLVTRSGGRIRAHSAFSPVHDDTGVLAAVTVVVTLGAQQLQVADETAMDQDALGEAFDAARLGARDAAARERRVA